MSISTQLASWKSKGSYIVCGPFKHRLFVMQIGDAAASSDRTLLLIHGFPESSYSYHKIINGMQKRFDRIILFDMLGYGLSDKPIQNFTYSLFEQADTVFRVWQHFGIAGGHMLSHDMGDSVATEILARHENGLMPGWFSDGLQSLTFTNGSMVLDLAKLRITQKILLSNYGHLMKNAVNFKLFNQQVRSAHGNDHLTDEDVKLLWEGNTLQNGNQKTYLTIKYLNDRKRFEKTRWLPALGQTKLPIHLCWGEDDAVANVKMAFYLKTHVCQNAKLSIMKDVGHFCQLDDPDTWESFVLDFFRSLNA